MTMPILRDWTTHDGEGAVATSLRYFSGTATYRTTFSYFHTFTFPHFHNFTFPTAVRSTAPQRGHRRLPRGGFSNPDISDTPGKRRRRLAPTRT